MHVCTLSRACACVCSGSSIQVEVRGQCWGNQLSPSATLVQGNQIQVASLISKYLCLPSHLTGSQFTHINQAATMCPASNWVTCVVAETCPQEAKHTNRICEMKTPLPPPSSKVFLATRQSKAVQSPVYCALCQGFTSRSLAYKSTL